MLTELFQNIDSEIAIYATAVITILSVAYPILLQFISQLDGTYYSTLILELFEDEPIKKWFKIQLYISLSFVFIWTLKLEPLPSFAHWGFWIDYSAALLVIISTFFLVVAFIRLVNKIFLYSTPSRVIPYLINKHNEGHGV